MVTIKKGGRNAGHGVFAYPLGEVLHRGSFIIYTFTATTGDRFLLQVLGVQLTEKTYSTLTHYKNHQLAKNANIIQSLAAAPRHPM